MGSAILLQGGTLLIPDDTQAPTSPSVKAIQADLLVVDDRIACIEPGLTVPAELAASHNVTVVDCARKIVTAGFIDTHHHLWQTQLRGRHGDHTLLDYMPTGNLAASFFEPADVFWGQLGGALEAIDCGTTTVVDHAHMNYSEQHSNHALAATLSSGLRSVFCYTPSPLAASWTPSLSIAFPLVQPWHLTQLEQLASLLKAHSRVSLGFGFDGYAFQPPDATQALFASVRAAAGLALITSHSFANPLLGSTSLVQSLAQMGLLGDDLLLSHMTGASREDLALLAQSGVAVSCTPASEMHQGLGAPIMFVEAPEPEPASCCCGSASQQGVDKAQHTDAGDAQDDAKATAKINGVNGDGSASLNGAGEERTLPLRPSPPPRAEERSELTDRANDQSNATESINGHVNNGDEHIEHITQNEHHDHNHNSTNRTIPQGLGCDSHSVTRGSMADQMRLALSLARAQRTQGLLDRGKFPRSLQPTVQQAFHLATAGGARAIRRQHELGSLRVGYKADIVVWDASGPGMVCAAREDALTAVVCFAGTREVECVIVDGKVRKKGGKLMECQLEGQAEGLLRKEEVATLVGTAGGEFVSNIDDAGNIGDAGDAGDAPAAVDAPEVPDVDASNVPDAVDGVTLSWNTVADALERSRLDIHKRMTGPLTRKRGDGEKEDGDGSAPGVARDALIAAFGLDASVLV